MPRKSTRSILFITISVFILAASACASPAAQPSIPTAIPASRQESGPVAQIEMQPAGEPGVSPTVEGESQPQSGGTFTIAIKVEPSSLDSAQLSDSSGYQIGRLIGATLVQFDQEGNLVPYLATSWDVSEDGLVYIFHLRQDVKFHNGDRLTAQDFVYTFKRLMDPATGSRVGSSQLSCVQTVEAADPYTLKVTLSRPYFTFLQALATYDAVFVPVSRRAVEESGAEYGRNPVGVGPYLFKEWVTGDHVSLVRNPDFSWKSDAMLEGAPFFDSIMLRFIPNTTTYVIALQAGAVDFASDVPVNDLSIVEETGLYNIVETYQKGAWPLVYLNPNAAPLDDILVRQAFNYSVNKEAMLQAVVEGNARPQAGPLSPSTPGYWPGIEQHAYNYNPERARSLLEQAGYTLNSGGIFEKDGRPLKVVITTYDDFGDDIVAQVLAAMLEDAGVETEIAIKEYGLVIDDVASGNYQVAVSGYGGSSADDVLYDFYHSAGVVPIIGAYDPELDSLLEKSRAAVDPHVHADYLNQIQLRILEQAYVIPLYSAKIFLALRNDVQKAWLRPQALLVLWNAYRGSE